MKRTIIQIIMNQQAIMLALKIILQNDAGEKEINKTINMLSEAHKSTSLLYTITP